MEFYDLILIESEIIQPMLGHSISSPTRSKWRRLANIDRYCRYCSAEQATKLVAVAMLRLQYPTKSLKESEILSFILLKRKEIIDAIKGCVKPSVLKMDDEVDAQGVVDLIAEHGGQRISSTTLRRWCESLGIYFKPGMTFDSFEVERLIKHCRQLRVERRQRGQKLGASRRSRPIRDIREAV